MTMGRGETPRVRVERGADGTPEPAVDEPCSDEQRMLTLLEERNRILTRQSETYAELAPRVDALRTELGKRPTRGEVVTRRTVFWLFVLSGVLVVLTTYVAISLHEAYRDQCELSTAGQPAPVWCDALFPFDNTVHGAPR